MRIFKAFSGEDGSIKDGLFEFLVDGIIPLLHTYYSTYFSPTDAASESLRNQEIRVSAQIFNQLLVRFSNDVLILCLFLLMITVTKE